MHKTVGFIGLGKMGQNIVLHLLEQGIDVVVYNRTNGTTQQFNDATKQQCNGKTGIGTLVTTSTIQEFVKKLPAPRVLMLMVSAGAPVDGVIEELTASGIASGDTVIDAGNSFYKDTVRRNTALSEKGITYIDSGTSGGLEGARNGACLMLGGDDSKVKELSWLWDAVSLQGLALEPRLASQGQTLRSWEYFGPSGAGHFVKMVHNGVEYGIDQAIGEGFAMLEKGPYQLDLHKVADNWSHGSVVRGWLIELLARALSKDPRLESFTGKVGGGETGRWMLETAKEFGVEAEILEEAMEARKKSQTNPTFATKVVSALRREYGGHTEAKASESTNNPINK